MVMTSAGVILSLAILLSLSAIGSEYTWLGLIVLVASIYLILRRSGFIGRKQLRGTSIDDIRVGAEVTDIETEWFGDIGRPHLEVTVMFADGSWYRDKVSPSSRRYREWGMRKVELSVSDWEVQEVVAAAVEEHERVASVASLER